MFSALLSVVLAINELMAANAGEAMSPAITFDSWIELYNPSDQAVSLAGMYLSDDPDTLKRWQMPADIGEVPAKGFKVVWLGSDEIRADQAPFKLNCDGGTIILSDGSSNIIASQTYPEAISHTAYARKTDGGDEWGWTATPTPGESNATSTFAEKRLAAPIVSVDSKLFTGSLQVKVDIPVGTRLTYTTDGSLPVAPEDILTEDPWTQWVKNGDCEGTDASCLISKDGNSGKQEKRITDGIGVNSSRGVTVHSIKSASGDNSSQFFVYTPDHVWQTGEQYRFTMKVRADKAATIKAFAHKKPGDEIKTQGGGWWGGGSSNPVSMLNGTYNVTTEWTEISFQGVITYEQAGEQGGWWEPVTYSLQTIAFNLNINKSNDNNFYFDEISW